MVPAGAALKVLLTTQETKSGKRPHQAFLTLHEESTGLEESFAFSVKDTGKAKLDIVRVNAASGSVTEADVYTVRERYPSPIPLVLITGPGHDYDRLLRLLCAIQ